MLNEASIQGLPCSCKTAKADLRASDCLRISVWIKQGLCCDPLLFGGEPLSRSIVDDVL